MPIDVQAVWKTTWNNQKAARTASATETVDNHRSLALEKLRFAGNQKASRFSWRNTHEQETEVRFDQACGTVRRSKSDLPIW